MLVLQVLSLMVDKGLLEDNNKIKTLYLRGNSNANSVIRITVLLVESKYLLV
jgi:hypothetical protein